MRYEREKILFDVADEREKHFFDSNIPSASYILLQFWTTFDENAAQYI